MQWRRATRTIARTLKTLGPVGQWMRDRMLMPLAAPMIGRALSRVYDRTVPLPDA